MTIDARTTPYGAAAYAALVAAVAKLKDGQPLRQVRVLVPTDRIGVTARRSLARGVAGSPGIAALEVLTVRRLAEQRAGQRLAEQGRRPLTGPVLAGVVREVLTRSPGLFAPVAEHPATVQALAGAHRTLRALDDDELANLGAGLPMVRDVVRLNEEIRAEWRDAFFDEVDLLTEALEPSGDRTPTVLFLPQDLDRTEVALLREIGRVAPLTVLAGVTGVATADAPVLEPWALTAPDLPEPLAVQVVTTTDPDDEVRQVVRSVLATLTDHPGHRIAVLYGSANPYARLLHEHLSRADVPVTGRGVRPTAELQAGRAARRLFGLLDGDLQRDAVLALVADAPVRWDGRRIPSVRWERLSRSAGVVRGADWQRVDGLRARRAAEAVLERGQEEPRDWLAERLDRESADAGALHAFVEHVRTQLTRLDASTSWAELSGTALALWTDLFGSAGDWYSPEEQRAAVCVESVLTSVHALDAVSAAASLIALRDLLDLELAGDVARVGQPGVGVHLAPVSEAVGLEVDRVFVVGLAEGLLPPRIADDALLPDEVRATTDGVLLSTRDRLARQQRHVLAAFAAAGEGAVASFPRGDLRRGGDRVPSRWVLPTLRHLTGNPHLQATDAIPHDDVAVVEVKSHADAVERAAMPANEQEWHQRLLALGRRDRVDLLAQLAHRPAAAAALRLTRARHSSTFTRFDGNLTGLDLPDPTAGKPVAPTSLETWTTCPHAYFLRFLLGVSPLEEPEEVLRISAAERGTVLHDTLDQWLSAEIENGTVPAASAGWSAAARTRLPTQAEKSCLRAETDGVTGYALLWEQDKTSILADLEAFVDADDARRATHDLTPVDTELPFGIQGHDPVEIALGGGRTLSLRGKADRIDRSPGGLVAVDYKTGKATSFEGLSAADPTLSGSKFQLPVYALAARQRHGDLPVRAEYWFISRRAGFDTVGYDVDDDVLARAVEAMCVVVDGIRSGLFLARPTPPGQTWGCEICALVGDDAVQRAWDAKAADPALAEYRTMIGAENV